MDRRRNYLVHIWYNQGEDSCRHLQVLLYEVRKVYRIRFMIIFLLAMLAMPSLSEAQPMAPGRGPGPGYYEGAPYGRYCPGYHWGPYGRRRAVKTADEARQAIEKYYSDSGQKVQVGKIEERHRYYEAEIMDPDGKLVDMLIIDKRSGRIRSIY